MTGKAVRGEPLKWLYAHRNYKDAVCLVWPFCVSDGYGITRLNGKNVRATRVMCELHYGQPIGLKHAAHSCGNRICVNPAHLRWASPKENEADKLLHGRHSRGERFWGAKLSDFDVLAIRGSKALPGAWLAKKYGVSRNYIYMIQSGVKREWM